MYTSIHFFNNVNNIKTIKKKKKISKVKKFNGRQEARIENNKTEINNIQNKK